ncbi:MAG: type II toxin-antitoxin system Phd/YefM family antitoxin [Candidatus Binatia bacterium]
MKTAPIAELKNRLSHYLRIVAKGETVTILDRGQPVAQITPIRSADDSLRRLAAQGLVRLPLRKVRKDFWRRPLAKTSRSVVEALLEDREDRF